MRRMLTEYAPAERATSEEIERQREYLFNNKSIPEIINSIPEMILILNGNRQAIFANNTMQKKMSAFSEDIIIGKRPGEIFQCQHAFRSEGGCGTTEFCRQCGAVNSFLICQKLNQKVQECRIIKKDSLEALDFRISASRLSLSEENYTLYSIIDISDEKRRQMLERVFFHDVLNTAGGIKALTELMDEVTDEEYSIYRKLLPGLSQKLIDEIQSQKILNSAESHELAVNFDIIKPANIISEVTELYKRHEVSKGREIRIAQDNEDIEFISDKALLSRVLGNMLKNALEASSSGEVVSIGCNFDDRDTLKFWVHNESYIPKNVQMQIFQRSFSTKGRDRGLGTYSMKLLGEKYLKGKVGFSSNEQAGTTFYISLRMGTDE